MAKWWEKEPIRFECQPDCFKCCMKPGIVHFDRGDIRKAADFLKTSPAELLKSWVKQLPVIYGGFSMLNSCFNTSEIQMNCMLYLVNKDMA